MTRYGVGTPPYRPPRFKMFNLSGEVARAMREDKLQRMNNEQVPKAVLDFLGTFVAYSVGTKNAGCCYCKHPTPFYEDAGRVFLVIPDPPTRGHGHLMSYIVCNDCSAADKDKWATNHRFEAWWNNNKSDQDELWKKHLELEREYERTH